jgi:hypothetical protein
MLVQTRTKDGRIVGLHIGADNVQQYFPASQSTIELVLGHLHIHCELAADFWRGQPEIYDARLADWLEAKFRCSRQPGGCVTLVLAEAGDGCYRLELPHTSKPEEPMAAPIPQARQQPSGAAFGD